MPDPYRLPTTNLSFSVCSTTIGNATPAAADDLSAGILFGANWTTNNALAIKGYGATQNSGADRIANTPAGTPINLSSYLNKNVRGDNSAFGSGPGSYWSLWDNQLGGTDDTFDNLYLYLWDSTKTYVLAQDALTSLNPSTNTGFTNIGDGVPLVHYAYWEVLFDINKNSTNPFTFAIDVSVDNSSFTNIFNINQYWSYPGTYSFSWQDSGNSAVETADPTAGFAFQMIFI